MTFCVFLMCCKERFVSSRYSGFNIHVELTSDESGARENKHASNTRETLLYSMNTLTGY